MNEVWRDISNYEGLYQISNLGRIKSRRKILKPFSRHGYLYVRLSKNGKATNCRVHRLVALAFIPNTNNYSQVNHIDGNKENNMYSNLEWCNNSQNITHSYKMGLHSTAKGELNGRHILTEDNVREIKRLCAISYKPTEISKLFNVSVSTIVDIYKGRTWSYL